MTFPHLLPDTHGRASPGYLPLASAGFGGTSVGTPFLENSRVNNVGYTSSGHNFPPNKSSLQTLTTDNTIYSLPPEGALDNRQPTLYNRQHTTANRPPLLPPPP